MGNKVFSDIGQGNSNAF